MKFLISISSLVVAGLWSAVPTNAQVNVTQEHNNLSRDGLYIDSAFTRSAAANVRRDLNFNGTISGNVYAQPLYVEGGPGGRAKVIVATESNNVYALDAITGTIIWQRNVGAPVTSGLPCGNINPLGITGPDDLAGKKVCSVTGSTPAENIRTNYPDAKLTEFDVYSKCAEALKNGQVEAVTTDNVILLGLINQDPEAFELVGKPFTKEPYGIGVKKGDTQFRTFINDTLEKAVQDGRYLKAWADTAGKVATTEPTAPAVDRY
jgi:ABC-type amino acid transport substrate-binding protein